MSLVSILAHVLTNGNYGIFRDELYYLDCARHLAWGYVDHPPFSIAVLKLSVTLFGDSVGAIRILPAFCGAALIVLIALMAVEMGANRLGVLLAALCALVVPVYTVNTGFYSMNAFDLALWALLFFLLLRIVRTGDDRLWVIWGIVLGLTALNKIGVIAFVIALIPALLLTGQFRTFKSRYFWGGAGLAAVMVVPFAIWQIVHGWPTLEFIRTAAEQKIVEHSFLNYLKEQILPMGPGLLPFWLLGLIVLLVWKRLRSYRAAGIIWIGALLFFGLQRSKPYYLSTAYAPLFAAAAVAIAHWISARHVAVRYAASVAVIGVILVTGFIVAPLTYPILEPGELAQYMVDKGIVPPPEEHGQPAALPQYLADRFGWHEMTVKVAAAYNALPDSLKSQCAIIASNYGEAGAINYFGAAFGLPRAYSQHNSHFLWGYGTTTGDVILTVDYNPDDLRTVYDSVTVVDIFGSPWAMPSETDAPICLCTGLQVSWSDAWRRGKVYD